MTSLARRALILAGLAATVAAAPVSFAQQNNKTPIQILVGFSPGGGTDLLARMMAQNLTEVLGRPVIVENMPGAGGSIAANSLHSAKPDGLTYMVANNAVPLFQTILFNDRNRWEFAKDFTPVAGLTEYPLALAVPTTLGVNNVAEWIEYLKANPNQATFGNIGAGGMTHMLGDALGKTIGIPLTPIPYKGAPPMITDLVGGHIPAAVGLLDNVMTYHKAGTAKIIATFTPERSPLTPDVPTFKEQGVDVLDGAAWQAIWAPAGTPQTEIDYMANALRQILANPKVQNEMRNILLVEPRFLTGEEVAALQAAELATWTPVVKDSGFQP